MYTICILYIIILYICPRHWYLPFLFMWPYFSQLSMILLLLFLVFFLINILILKRDVQHRKIPNTYLLCLCGVLIIWLYVFGISSDTLLSRILFALALLLGWAFFYKEDGFLWSWDIKYAAILGMFLGEKSLSIFIWNIGVLTIIVLIFWTGLVSGILWAMRDYISKSSPLFRQVSWKQVGAFMITGCTFLFDWIIIGYIFKEGMNFAMSLMHGVSVFHNDFYFLLSIGIFLVRGSVRKYLFTWKYRPIALVWIMLFYASMIQSSGLVVLLGDIWWFAKSIWLYAIVFAWVYFLTNNIFILYNELMDTIWNHHNYHKTLPYSCVIFAGFCIVYFWNINLLYMIQKL